jgi:hypothetical protein
MDEVAFPDFAGMEIKMPEDPANVYKVLTLAEVQAFKVRA